MKKKSIIYIDGFNLYYGMLKNTKYKWLDLEAYFTRLRLDDDVKEIKYFTSTVFGKDNLARQKSYLKALATT